MITTHGALAGMQVFERGWLSSNMVLFIGDENTALVDSGYATHASQTLQLVLGALKDRPLDKLLNTHLHSDHCGGNALLQAHFAGLCTLIPPGQSTAITRWDPGSLTYAPTGQTCAQFKWDQTLEPGSTVKLGNSWWQVHAAPGHDTHAVLLFEPDTKTLISGDALWENGFGVVFPELEGENAFKEVGETLDRIEALQPQLVIPGHGAMFTYQNAILERARQRLAAFVDAPSRHANHAAKVLLKFKLLELQQSEISDFLNWAERTEYFELVRKRFFSNALLRPWIEALTQDLVKSGVAMTDGTYIWNVSAR